MTTEQQNKVWASLPDDFKEEVRKLYNNYRVYNRIPQEAVRDIIEILFGVSATAPTPKFKVGDKVRIVSTRNIALQDKVGTVAGRPYSVSNDLVKVKFPDKSFTYLEPCQLVPCTEQTATEGEEEEDWQHYRMELAAKIAVAYAENNRYAPSEIGAKAVEVANDVVDGLNAHNHDRP